MININLKSLRQKFTYWYLFTRKLKARERGRSEVGNVETGKEREQRLSSLLSWISLEPSTIGCLILKTSSQECKWSHIRTVCSCEEQGDNLALLLSTKGYSISHSVLDIPVEQTWTMKTSHGISPGSTEKPQRSQTVCGMHERKINIMWHLQEVGVQTVNPWQWQQ